MSTFSGRIENLFRSIFRYHFKRRPIRSERKTPFGNFTNLVYCKASGAPLALLLKEGLICEPTAIEVLWKTGDDQKINDTDLEAVIMSVREKREERDTLFILVSFGDIPSDDFERLFRAFTRHLVMILALGKRDILKLERWVKKENFNACLVHLFLLADKVTSEDKPLPGIYGRRAQWQNEATMKRIDKLGKIQAPQLRTLIKKLHFLLSFEKSGGEIAKACTAAKISRKTFYLWFEKDLAFRKLVHI